MNEHELTLKSAETLLAQWTLESTTPDPQRLDVCLSPTNLLAAVKAIQEAHWGYLAAITGLDLGADKHEIEVLYHFCADAAVLTLRVRVPYGAASVPSICGIVPSATFFERELMEMLGVNVEGTPNSDHLYLPDNWIPDVYPLRKAFVPSASAEGSDSEVNSE
ncbi:MAG: NADH-quinone oxidoreductase subunit C [Anaerolineae bacterium]|nr:NADH-quinone oxidoreductase subunit C [Anaerolineae bacterium]